MLGTGDNLDEDLPLEGATELLVVWFWSKGVKDLEFGGFSLVGFLGLLTSSGRFLVAGEALEAREERRLMCSEK